MDTNPINDPEFILWPPLDEDESVEPKNEEFFVDKLLNYRLADMVDIVPSTVEAVKSAPREIVEFVKDIPEHVKDAPEDISEFVKEDVPSFLRRVRLLIKTVVLRGTWQERLGLYLITFGIVSSLRTINVLSEALRVPYAILTLPLASLFLLTATLSVIALLRAFHGTAVPEKATKKSEGRFPTLKQAYKDLRGDKDV